MERQDGSDGVPMGRRERHKKISLDSGSEKSGEEGSRAVCRKKHSGKATKRWRERTRMLGSGVSGFPASSVENTFCDDVSELSSCSNVWLIHADIRA